MPIVEMHFGDGSFHEIEVEATDLDEAVAEAQRWVKDNAFFQAHDEDGRVMAERSLS